MKFRLLLQSAIFCLAIAVLLTTSVVPLDDPIEKARRYTSQIEFDYIAWTAKAMAQKAGQSQVNATQFLSPQTQHLVTLRYFDLIRQLESLEWQIQQIYADPKVENPEITAGDLLLTQKAIENSLKVLAPLAEEIMQSQISSIFVEQGIGFLSQSIPPVLFHSSPLPKALIVSPRDSIRQEVNLSLLADLSLEEITTLENKVASSMDASALVVDVGGIGVYPTMVQRSSNIQWTIDTIAHEWAHNYLTLHPLGMNYDTTPELRTMNETTASIVGTEISQEVLRQYYPELVSLSVPSRLTASLVPPRQTFDFRHEMHVTRIKVDELLSKGKISEAEIYMEERRVLFVQNGYMIRKLNQAYFAFYGAYADEPGGAAGEDPVGPAVRAFRAQSESLAEFLKQIARMNSFARLQSAVN